jgi:hypothetical protein
MNMPRVYLPADLDPAERRRLFATWLRTGTLPAGRDDGVELKFNPWHDPRDGRFTSGPQVGDPQLASSPRKRAFTGHGGSFGGGGATGSWDPPPSRPPSPNTTHHGTATAVRPYGPHVPPAPRANIDQRDQRLTVTRNGYAFEIDSRGRTRRVTGHLTIADTPVRSRAAQAKAGGSERRPGDDGGHYIAARFNGPTDAFNHFAQDANINRGRYRSLEDQWPDRSAQGETSRLRSGPRSTAAPSDHRQ